MKSGHISQVGADTSQLHVSHGQNLWK
jgi:hypothetical protein